MCSSRLQITKNPVCRGLDMATHRIGRLWKFKSEKIDEWVHSGGAAENEDRDKE